MPAMLILACIAFGPAQAEKPVTAAEKKEFFELLAKLPTKGEFFTDEAITKAVPYTRVLLALGKIDLADRDMYPFLALGSGLLDRKEAVQYGKTNFGKIAHPTVKLFWAVGLFRTDESVPEILNFLRKALDSKEDARTLSLMLGPNFQEFKEDVIRSYEKQRPKRERRMTCERL